MSVVIIGGNFAGITAAKLLMKQKINVTLISPNDKAYFNMTIPRLLTEPEKIPLTLFPITSYLDPKESFKHIPGLVTELDPENNQVTVKLNNGTTETAFYQNLVIATGTKAVVDFFKIVAPIDPTVDKLKALAERIKHAKSIAIIGGNTLGVELCADIITHFPKKAVNIYNSNERLLSFMPEGGSNHATKVLTDAGAGIFNSTRVEDYSETSITVNGKTEEYDVVIPALGVTPNTDFLPKNMLDGKGYLKTDQYFQVSGYKNILGFGEVNAITEPSIHDIVLFQHKTLKKSAEKMVLGRDTKLAPYSKGSLSVMVALGKNNGLGYWAGWRLPNFVVRKFKSETYMIPKLETLF